MFSNLRRGNALLLIFGALIVIASAFPWVSVSFVNGRGIDSWRGFVSIATGLLIGTFAASQIWRSFIDSKIQPYLRFGSILMNLCTIGLFAEIGYKTLNASKQISELGNSVDSSFGDFGDSLNQFANSIANEFNPRLAIGWYMGLIGLVASLALLLLKPNVEIKSPIEIEVKASETLVSEKINKPIGKAIVYGSIVFLVIVASLILFVSSTKNSPREDLRGKPYLVSLEVKSAAKFLSIDVTRQVDKWNGFGYAKYTEWANRFITMSSSFQTITDSETKLRRSLEKEFDSNEYSNEQFVMDMFNQFEARSQTLQTALNNAMQCSLGLPSNNECDPQFRLVSSGLGTLKGTSDKIAAYLE
jgi:hypothetical protein